MSAVRAPSRNRWSRAVPVAGAALVAGLLSALLFALLPPLAALEGAIADRIQVLARPVQPRQHEGISVLTVTEATLARLPYRAPLDRGFLGDLLEALRDAGVAGVALDILLDQPTEAAKDARLAGIVADYPVPVVIAWADARAGLTDKQQAWLAAFRETSKAMPGDAGLVYDADGVIRRHALIDPGSGTLSLPAALAGERARVTESPAITDWLGTTADGKEPFQVLPAHSIVAMAKRPALLRKWLEGRLVLVGADLPQQDRHRTALAADPLQAETIPGVLLHAHVTAQLLDGRRIGAAGVTATVLLCVGAGVLAVLLALSGIRFWLQCLLALVVLVGWAAATVGIAVEWRFLVPLASVVAAFVVAFATGSSLEALRNRREKRFIRSAFSHYVAPSVVDMLTAAPERLQLGGERKLMSFLFSDIAGFTSMSEKLPATELASLLNAYLGGMSRLVLAHGGTLDKYIGDAVVALFGAPVDQPDHARRAIDCALAMDAWAEEFRAAHAATGIGQTRIGVHSGEAAVGNFGGEDHFNYTAMGDAMNTAARLEGANKAFGTRVAISGDTVRLAGWPDDGAGRVGGTALQCVGRVVLKGRKGDVVVFTPVTEVADAWLDAYRAALDSLDNDPDLAQNRLEALRARHPDDPLVALHLGRLAAGECGSRFELKEK
ncbi:MAG: adenylate/guanylate cyclase domain-containing protein [Pseudomonadota bacterium]|nr:adenylate/guanylate cyclase domain-containing protein [Pseudomonadota bacterium]